MQLIRVYSVNQKNVEKIVMVESKMAVWARLQTPLSLTECDVGQQTGIFAPPCPHLCYGDSEEDSLDTYL